MAAIIILGGARGSGKSSLMMAAATTLRRAGLRPSGIACPGRYRDGRKTGILCVDLGLPPGRGDGADGFELASVDPAFPDRQPGRSSPAPDLSDPVLIRYGKWIFRRDALAKADSIAAAALSSVEDGRVTAIVDEIGPLELELGAGFSTSLRELDRIAGTGGSTPGGGSVVVACRTELGPILAARWPGASLVDLDSLGTDRAVAKLLELAGA